MQGSQQLTVIFFLISSILLAEGAVSVSSHPNGDIHLEKCSVGSDSECTRNPRTKSYLVCGAANVVNDFAYEFQVRPLDGSEGGNVHPSLNYSQFNNDGISATIVAIDENCTEVFIRFFGSSDHLHDSNITFVVTRQYLTEYSELFNIVYPATETAGTTSTITDVTTAASITDEMTTVSNAAATTNREMTARPESAAAVPESVAASAPAVDRGTLITAGVPPIAIVLGLLGIAVVVIVVLGILLYRSRHGEKRCYDLESPPPEPHAVETSFTTQNSRPNSPESPSFPATEDAHSNLPSNSPHPTTSQHDISTGGLYGQCDVSSDHILPS